LDNSRPVSSF